MDDNHGLRGNIAVIGDVMLDVYITGNTTRISPEAPVPVVSVMERRSTLGGAGNVGLNLVGLGCKVWLYGAVGDDSEGADVKKILDKNEINDCLFVDQGILTTTKTRIISQNQQLIRFDTDGIINNGGFYFPTCEELKSQGINVVILSDYDKGVLTDEICQNLIGSCLKQRIPVLVDPKRGDWGPFRNSTLIKPNLIELGSVVGKKLTNRDMAVGEARKLMMFYGIRSVLITMGSQGMSLVGYDKTTFIPTKAREVFDVSGAGDTVIATIAACLCSGYSLDKAAEIANIAAGIVVGKVGTSPISYNELMEASERLL